MQMESYLKQGTERILCPEEIRALCDLIHSSDQAANTCLALVSARTAAGRANSAAVRLALGEKAVHRRRPSASPRQASDPAYDSAPPDLGLPFLLTRHCFERYIKRHASDVSKSEAESLLMEEARNSSPIKERSSNGDHQWVGKSGVVFVVKRDAFTGKLICLTILPGIKEAGGPCYKFRKNRHSRRSA